ncbi:MAG: hypothetical protein ABW217_01385 [Polyangiaceae bacterium]
MKILYSIIGLSCFGLLAGCGGDDDGGSSTQVDTGIAEDKALSDVTSEEYRGACENMGDQMREVINPDAVLNLYCTVMAAAQTETEAECNDEKADCLEESRDLLGDAGEIELDCSSVSEFQGCDVTVGVLESCLTDTLDVFRSVLGRYSCADAGTLSEEAFDEIGASLDAEPPASCEPLIDQCDGAGVIGDDDAPDQ